MKRKTLLLLTITITMAATVFAQTNSISGGLSLGGNLSHLRSDNKPDNLDYEWRGGAVGGIWLNFPVGNTVSIQPNALYSRMGTRIQAVDVNGVTSKVKQNLGYLSLPLYLKVNAGNSIAFLAGPQFDFLVGANLKDENDNKIKNEDEFKQFDIALTGGIQIMPNYPVSLTLRYIHGMKDIAEPSAVNQTFVGSIHNQAFQGTVNFRLFGGKQKAVAVTTPEVPAVRDSDGDGINDDVDKCPNTPGVAKYNGCPVPDTDNDGINDDEDKCPTVAGTAKYNGCPVPDTDNDGINDENDKCPTVPGTERYQGCPVPDSDNDGINDEEDNCPKLAGTAANHGCPEIDASTQSKVNMMAKSISWTTATGYTLSTKSNKSLDQVASMLTADPNLKVTVSAHTSTTGDAAKTLSQNRADAVKAYLVSKGVNESQIEATGYGGEQPIGTGAKNQRVELKLHY